MAIMLEESRRQSAGGSRQTAGGSRGNFGLRISDCGFSGRRAKSKGRSGVKTEVEGQESGAADGKGTTGTELDKELR